MNKIKHNLSESYLLSLTEQQRIDEMSQWSSSEWQQYYCPNGTMSLEEFSKLGLFHSYSRPFRPITDPSAPLPDSTAPKKTRRLVDLLAR